MGDNVSTLWFDKQLHVSCWTKDNTTRTTVHGACALHCYMPVQAGSEKYKPECNAAACACDLGRRAKPMSCQSQSWIIARVTKCQCCTWSRSGVTWLSDIQGPSQPLGATPVCCLRVCVASKIHSLSLSSLRSLCNCQEKLQSTDDTT